MSYIPNILTILRIASAPILVILLANQQFTIALIVFLSAGLSDVLDGFLAHRLNCVTTLGQRLDPIADKCLLMTTFIMLTYLGHLPFWLTVTVVFRDILIVGGTIFMMLIFGKINVRPLFISKINTFLQIVLVLIILFHLTYPAMFNLQLTFAYITVGFMAFISGLAYVWQGVLFAMNSERKANNKQA